MSNDTPKFRTATGVVHYGHPAPYGGYVMECTGRHVAYGMPTIADVTCRTCARQVGRLAPTRRPAQRQEPIVEPETDLTLQLIDIMATVAEQEAWAAKEDEIDLKLRYQ